VAGIEPGKYAQLTREWKSGDRVHIAFDMAVRLEHDPSGSQCVALMRGPLVLALDNRIPQPQAGSTPITFHADASGVVDAHEACSEVPDGIRLAMDIACTTAEGKPAFLRMCDYASAGHTWSEPSTFRVWLPQPLNLEKPFAP
jgi:DUF1680 family protein